jgi:lauroyl/myristoyl acyltransferase
MVSDAAVKSLKLFSCCFQNIPPSLYVYAGRVLSRLSRFRYQQDYRNTIRVLLRFLDVDEKTAVSWADHIFYLRALKQLDFFLFPSLTEKSVRKFVVFNQADIRSIVDAAPQATIFAGFHLGNQNWFPPVCCVSGLNLHVLRAGRACWFNRMSSPGKVFIPGRDVKLLLRTLKQGQHLALVGDVFPDISRTKYIKVMFFHRNIMWPVNVARLVRAGRTNFYVFFSPRLADGRVEILLKRLDIPSPEEKDFVQETTRAYVRALEEFLYTQPQQWLRWHYLTKLMA